jgi:HSP20 family protein
MALTNLMPWGRGQSVTAPGSHEDNDPFSALSRDMNRLLDDFTRGFGVSLPPRFGLQGTWPHVEVSETDKDVTVVAELPGMDEKQVEVLLQDGVLTLRGEKKSESNTPVYSERWHGQFQRSLQIGSDVDPEQVNAAFKNGVLTLTLAKRPESQRSVKRIQVNNV